MGLTYQPEQRFDAIGPLPDGMNSNLAAVLLPKTLAASITNGTVRGGFLKPRSPYLNITLTFTDATVQAGFEEALFQGCCYYSPDIGNEMIVVMVGGRMFTVTPDTQNEATASVAEITLSDTNSETNPINWLWQAERWVIVNDGETQPIIYDGGSARRATIGAVIATLSAGGAIPPIGDTVVVTLTAVFSGEYNKAVYVYNSGTLIGLFEVLPYATTTGQKFRLLNVNDPPGTIHTTGTTVVQKNSYTGRSLTAHYFEHGSSWTIEVTPPFTAAIGSILNVNPASRKKSDFRVTGISGNYITVTCIAKTDGGWEADIDMVVNTALYLLNAKPDVAIATTTANFTAPAIGGTVDVSTAKLYTGTDGAYVYIGTALYQIYKIVPQSSATVYLKNLNVSGSGTISSSATIREIPELPIGRMGVYGMGRNWVCLADGRSFIASDLVGGSSGSPANNYRDAVLNITENNYLAGGGVFRVPGAGEEITAMVFSAQVDTSLGQGPLQVATHKRFFSCNAPVDRDEWQELKTPILTQSLISNGSESHWSTVVVNSDITFRSLDGLRSLLLGQRDFATRRGNTPISNEVVSTLSADNRELLKYSSALVFDNRLLMTANPVQSARGVHHSKLVVMNLDPSSSLRGSLPDVYDGIWTGINTLQLVTGRFTGTDRAFAITYDTTAETIGLAEILPSTYGHFDDTDEEIPLEVELPPIFVQPNPKERQLLQLEDGELVIDELDGDTVVSAYFRPDYSSTWKLWKTMTVASSPAYQHRLGLGQPPVDSDTETERPHRVGYFFQVKLAITGYCSVKGLNAYANTLPHSKFAPPSD